MTQTHLTLRAGFRYRFDNPLGIEALKLDAEDDTTTAKDDDELTVFGVNSGEHVVIYNTSLTAIAFYGRQGEGVGEFSNPTDVCANRLGDVVVSDTGNDRLHVLRYENDRLHHVRFLEGVFEGLPLTSPTGLALESGELYVCDPAHQRILVMDLSGALKRVLAPRRGTRALLHAPFAIDVIRQDAEFNFFKKDFVVVTDSLRSRLVQMRRDGSLLRTRSVAQFGPQVQRFDFVALDYHANVYASDRNGYLHKFDRRMNFLLSIGRPGRGDYEFDEPRGIGLYRRFGQLFVAERQGAQYLWIGADVFSPTIRTVQRLEGGRWKFGVRFFSSEHARIQLDLIDASGQARATLQGPRWTLPGIIERNFTVRFGVDPSSVRLRIQAYPLYSSRKILTVEKTSPPVELVPGE